MIEVHIDGLKSLDKALGMLPQNIAKKHLNNAVAAGARIIRDEARNRAPVSDGKTNKNASPSGTLKRSIIVKWIRELSKYGMSTFYVTVRSGKKYRKQGKKGNLSQDAYYWRYVEFGHKIVPRFKGKYTDYALKGRTRQTGLAIRRRNATGSVPPKPFIRPAFESKKQEALNAIINRLTAAVESEAKNFVMR
jgi:HK97 gp10 family phage protein